MRQAERLHHPNCRACNASQETVQTSRRGYARRAIVRLPVGLAGGPGEEEIASRGDCHIVASWAALDVGEAALIVGRPADTCELPLVSVLSDAWRRLLPE